MKKEACKYQLKSGALLIDPDDPTKNCTKFNLTNELAEYHLRRNPKCAKFFSAIPKEPLTATDTTKDVVSVNVEKEQKRKRKSRK